MRAFGTGEDLRRQSDHRHHDRGDKRLRNRAASRADAILGEQTQICARQVGLDRVRLRAEHASQPLFDVRHRAPHSPV
jgi:hypothetical protein